MRVSRTFAWFLLAIAATACAAQQPLPDAPAPQPATTAVPPSPLLKPIAPPKGPVNPSVPAASQPAAALPTGANANVAQPTPADDTGDLFKLTKNVNLVLVPVTVDDRRGRPIEGLEPTDFAVFDNGAKQPIQFFTAEPFPLSVAIVVDTLLDDAALQKVQETVASLLGAFGELDEVALYSYENHVVRLSDFTRSDQLDDAVHRLRFEKIPGGGQKNAFDVDRRHGQQPDEQRRQGEPPGVMAGPMSSTPTVGGRQVIGMPSLGNLRADSRVLNDALLTAAKDLGAREKGRRKMLLVISDGREHGSDATPRKVQRALLEAEISVYALRVGDWSTPAYHILDWMPSPRGKHNGLLDRYVSSTGGSLVTAVRRADLENAYAFLADQARMRYTLGYVPPASAPGEYRKIAVTVTKAHTKVSSRAGYYTAGVAPAQSTK